MELKPKIQGETDILCDRSQILDRLKVMKIQESSTTYRCSDYLSKLPSSSNYIDDWCRSQMIGWCFQVVDCIGFNRETVLFAISYIDRFLSHDSPRSNRIVQDRKEYQLAVMTALFMSIKLHERKIIDISLMMEFSRGAFTKNDFINMESDLLIGLKWRLNGPTAVSFLEHFVNLMPFSDYGISSCDVLDVARYRIELSANDYKTVHHTPSKIAVAALISSIKTSTAIPELMCHRRKLLSVLEEIAGMNLNSASLRTVVQRTEGYEEKPFITSRRPPSDASCMESDLSRRFHKMGGFHTHSPRGVSH